MTDIVNLYPKSSCPCYDCRGVYKLPNPEQTFMSSLGVHMNTQECTSPMCSIPEQDTFFGCFNRVELGEGNVLVPMSNTDKPASIQELNPEMYSSKIATGFDRCSSAVATSCQGCGSDKGSGTAHNSSCPNDTYVSMDPRQFDSARAQRLQLDRPPIDGRVRLKNIYSSSHDYHTGYNTYSKMKDGQISYYVDDTIADAFYHPVYSEPARETSQMYKDPMGAYKPEYNRSPLINTENPAVTMAASYPYNLSFLQDSQSYREDLISLQQRKNNQQKWSARWTGSIANY